MPAATFYLAPILTVGIDKRVPRSGEKEEKEREEKKNHCHALGKKENLFFCPWHGKVGTPTRFGSRGTR